MSFEASLPAKTSYAAPGLDLSDLDGFWSAPTEHWQSVFELLRGRRELPFYPEPQMGQSQPGRGFYAVTRLDDVVAASRRPEIFRSAEGIVVTDFQPETREFFDSMINTDNPRHARLRRIVSRDFTPRRLRALNDTVSDTARCIVDRVIDDGGADAVTDIAAQLPLQVICDMMGVPSSQHQFVFDRTNILLGPDDPEYIAAHEDRITAMVKAGNDLAELVVDLGAYRADNPTDDVTSALVNARVEGERLTAQELASFFVLLVLAGNETTRNAISWGIHALTENPSQRAIWLDDLDVVTPTAVDEIVRWASPVIYMRRTLAHDWQWGDQQLSAGDKLLLFYWAANRDPSHFVNPDCFDVRRSPNPHVGFGGPSPHFCLGANLARLEIAAMFRELLTRIPDVHTTAAPDRLRSMFINGIKHLPVEFTHRV